MTLNKDLLTQEAPYLDSTRNKLWLIGILSVFTIVFLLVYNPFNSEHWDGHVTGYVIVGSSFMLFSQFALRGILKKQQLRLYELILFGMGELLVIPLLIQLTYGPEFPTPEKNIAEYLVTLKFVALIVIGPYILSVWILAFKHKISSYQAISESSPGAKDLKKNTLLTITGENDNVIMAIKYDQLLYVKSSGNYLEIYYLRGETLTKQLVRSSLKELEAKITDPAIVRIHRSYMVNRHKISSFKKERKGYKLVVQHAPEEFLPVSLSYKEKFEEALALNAGPFVTV
ncbi:LytR/AlgR family response regulator transcription factor [Robertkochia flava]|uniref:LytR/AlgR family response regulator transcription factor n=1 Tax=Robertkochia flava TaxID=3447986 RepID=UPI001CC94AF5|nr:LytTR family DNA-binding domain-containing protein [Robertkochia marina]